MLERAEEIAKSVFAAKRRRRDLLRRLSFEEKVEILVRLQKTAGEIVANRGRASRAPWAIREGPRGAPDAAQAGKA